MIRLVLLALYTVAGLTLAAANPTAADRDKADDFVRAARNHFLIIRKLEDRVATAGHNEIRLADLVDDVDKSARFVVALRPDTEETNRLIADQPRWRAVNQVYLCMWALTEMRDLVMAMQSSAREGDHRNPLVTHRALIREYIDSARTCERDLRLPPHRSRLRDR